MTETGGFEAGLKRLHEIVERLESGELPLEEGVALYKEGLAVARDCRRRLEQAKLDVGVFQDGMIKELSEETEGGPDQESGVD